jgi:hypothetical protein
MYKRIQLFIINHLCKVLPSDVSVDMGFVKNKGGELTS